MVGHAVGAAFFLCHMPGCGWNASTQISERCCQTAPPAPTAKPLPSTRALHCTALHWCIFALIQAVPAWVRRPLDWIQAWHAGHLMLCFALPWLSPVPRVGCALRRPRARRGSSIHKAFSALFFVLECNFRRRQVTCQSAAAAAAPRPPPLPLPPRFGCSPSSAS